MDKKTIQIKENKNTNLWEYISITSNNNGITLYSYYNGLYIDTPQKTTFNKYSFIEFLKSINISKKIIKNIERN